MLAESLIFAAPKGAFFGAKLSTIWRSKIQPKKPCRPTVGCSGVFGLKTSLTKSAQDIADKVLKTSLTMWSNSGPWIGRVLRDIWCGGR